MQEGEQVRIIDHLPRCKLLVLMPQIFATSRQRSAEHVCLVQRSRLKEKCIFLTMHQVPLSVLPYFRFLSEEAQRNVMSQLIDNFQTTSITKRGVATTSAAPVATPASSSASSPEGLAFMRSPTFAKVTGLLWPPRRRDRARVNA